MKLKSISLRNLLSFGEEQKITFTDRTVIVGTNNSGKTNLFRSISLLGDKLLDHDRRIDVSDYFFQGDDVDDFEVTAEVELEDDELDLMESFCTGSLLMKSHGPFLDGQDETTVDEFKAKIVPKIANKTFRHLFKHFKIQLRGDKKEGHTTTLSLILQEGDKQLFLHQFGNIVLKSENPTRYTEYAFLNHAVNSIRKKVAIDDFLTSPYHENKMVPPIDVDAQNLFQILSSQPNTTYVISLNGFRFSEVERRFGDTNAVKILRNLFGANLRDRDIGRDIFDILGLIYNKSIQRISDVRSRPRNLSLDHISATLNDINIFSGEELALVLFSLKNNPHHEQRHRFTKILDAFKDMTGLEFDIALDKQEINEKRNEIGFLPLPVSTERFQRTSDMDVLTRTEKDVVKENFVPNIQVISGNKAISLEFSAAGIFEIILLLTVSISKKNKILLFDEPALNIHPTMQYKFLNLVSNISSENQILMITHSPHLIDEDLAKMWRFSSFKGQTVCYNLGCVLSHLDTNEREKFRSKLRRWEVRSLLFSRGIVVVEGPSDKTVIESVDRFLSSIDKGSRIEENEYSVLFGDGKEDKSLMKLISLLKIPYCIIVDYDALMSITTNIEKIKTSAILRHLFNINQLSKQEIEFISGLQTKVVKINGTEWYNLSSFDNLLKIAQSHNVFVFTTDLEGVLMMPVNRRMSKPLQDIKKINDLIEQNKVPDEFLKMTCFIKEKLADCSIKN